MFISIFLAIFTLTLYSEESFITQFEYGEMLYKNPRGIGCHKCHGLKGKGKVIAKYRHRAKVKELSTKAIDRLSFEEFSNSFTGLKKRDIMPKYYLTREEIKALYLYLKKINSN